MPKFKTGYFFTSILITALTFCFLIVVIYYQTIFFLEDTTNRKLNQVVRNIDELLFYAEESLLRTDSFSGTDCTPEVLENIRVVVAASPNIRSIELVRDGRIYCSSVFGRYSDLHITYGKNRFSVHLSEITNPGVPFLALQHFSSQKNYSVVATIDGFHIAESLNSVNSYFPIYLKVNKNIISSLTNSFENSISNKREKFYASKLSYNEKYSVYSNYSYSDVMRYMLNKDIFFILMALIISLATGLFSLFIVNREKSLKELLEKSIEKNEIVPWIQPIFDKNGNIHGGEILARWIHPEKGFIPADNFIPLAEENNLIIPLTYSLFLQVQKKLKDTWNLLPNGSHLAFNISPECFLHDDFINEVNSFMECFPVLKPNLVLELTERQPLADETIHDVINRLHSKNIKFALDDFGTGYSNINYLQKYKFDLIKIDKSFIRDLTSKTHIGNIVGNIVQMTHSIGAQNIAEGVETQEQFDELKSLGVEFYQGYLLAKPMTLDNFNAQIQLN